jgi:hypothetical protein
LLRFHQNSNPALPQGRCEPISTRLMDGYEILRK